MGLSGRKAKQRIGNDPRNLSWADDAARFGSNYLSKFGWDPSKGLGVGGEGRTSHIKVAQKLDMMGIGAAHQADPDGVAWKQNKDFENLLKRLNQANEDVEGDDDKEGSTRVASGFVQQKGKLEEEEEETEEEKVKDRKKDDNKERRKKNDEQARAKDKGKQKSKDATEKKKKRKRDGNDADKKQKKLKRKSNNDDEDNKQDELSPTSPEPTPTIEQKVTRVVPRHRSHRARHIAAKSLSSKSAAAISEILGIAPTPSLSSKSSGTQTPQGAKLTPIYDDTNEDIGITKITTSTRSLQDYFKEKLGGLKEPSASTATEVDYDDIPRGGLGSRPLKQVLM